MNLFDIMLNLIFNTLFDCALRFRMSHKIAYGDKCQNVQILFFVGNIHRLTCLFSICFD
jgi:hypothetical protein